MRRTDRAVRRGTSLQGSDRTAGDSSPVTQENGRLRGRPEPTGGPCKNAQDRIERLRAPRSSSTMRRQPKSPRRHPHCPLARGTDQRRNPPAPLPKHRRCPDVGADEKKGPAAPPRGALRSASPAVPRGGQVRDTVPHSSWSWSMSLLRSYGSVVGPLGSAPVGPLDGNSGCR
ncbi:hypothetical protein SAFG77S_05728 [Streptomyces afghaniensis]